MFIRMTTNEYGTSVSEHRCDTCSSVFTLCPAQPTEERFGGNCLGEGCDSYDTTRDIDRVWEGVQRIVATEPMEPQAR